MGTIGLIVIVFFIVDIGIGIISDKFYVACELDNSTTITIKGIAIFIIILSHIGGKLGTRFLTPLGGIGVAMFLFLSGYGLSKSYVRNQLSFYWRKRFIAIYPAYLIASIVAWIANGVTDVKITLLGIIFIKPAIPYGWYFQYLLLWYAVFWISSLAHSGKWKWAILLTFAVISFCFLPEIMAEQSVSFISGVFVSTKEECISKNVTGKNKVFISIGLILVGIVALGIKQIEIVRTAPQIIFKGVQLLIKFPIAIGMIMLLLSPNINTRIKFRGFYLLGLISYELYLLHGMCINYINSIGTVYKLISLLLSVIFAYLLKIINDYLGKTLRNLIIESWKNETIS